MIFLFTSWTSFSIGELDDNLAVAKSVAKINIIGNFKLFKVIFAILDGRLLFFINTSSAE